MNTVPTKPSVHAQRLQILGDDMDRVDLELFDAERAGNRSQQIACLFERAAIWLRYGQLLTSAGQDAVGAALSAQRDRANALRLQAEAASE